MYLSRLILNTWSRSVQRDIGSPREMHRTVLRGFPDDLAQDQERVLYRLDQMERGNLLYLLVQSQQPPDWTGLDADYLAQNAVENPVVKQVDLDFSRGQRLAFRLRANPTKRLGKSAESNEGKRVGLYRVDEQIQWLNRKAQAGGFVVESVLPTQQQRTDDRKRNLKFFSVQFDGILQVTEPSLLQQTLDQGVGSGKAFGFGLLSVAPAS